MTDSRFPRLVSLACHDLRTPLATIFGFARTLNRMETHDERTTRFLAMIEEAAEQMTGLLDELGVEARIQSGRWEPVLRAANTRELAQGEDERIVVEGEGEEIETEIDAIRRALEAFASAALRHGPLQQVTWRVSGRTLELSPVTEAAAAVLAGDELRDLGSTVARSVVEELGGAVELDGTALRVRL
jgi:two-component system, OmpR family, sensor histidine kinase KdpD